MVFRWEISPGLSFSLEMSYIPRVCQVEESGHLFPIKVPLQGEYKGWTFPSGQARYGRESADLLFNKIHENIFNSLTSIIILFFQMCLLLLWMVPLSQPRHIFNLVAALCLLGHCSLIGYFSTSVIVSLGWITSRNSKGFAGSDTVSCRLLVVFNLLKHACVLEGSVKCVCSSAKASQKELKVWLQSSVAIV